MDKIFHEEASQVPVSVPSSLQIQFFSNLNEKKLEEDNLFSSFNQPPKVPSKTKSSGEEESKLSSSSNTINLESRANKPVFSRNKIFQWKTLCKGWNYIYELKLRSEFLDPPRCISKEELFKDIFLMLQGVSSSTFLISNEHHFEPVLTRIPSTSGASLYSYLVSLCQIGTNFYRLELIAKYLIQNTHKKGLIAQAFGDSIFSYLQFYRMKLLEISTTSLVELLDLIQPLTEQLNALTQICQTEELSVLDFDKIPFGVDLLNKLYFFSLETTKACHSLLWMFLEFTSVPYLTFVQEWIYNGNVFDEFGEFKIPSLSQENAIQLFQDSLPIFLKDVAHPLLVCGNMVQILKSHDFLPKKIDDMKNLSILNRKQKEKSKNGIGENFSLEKTIDSLSFLKEIDVKTQLLFDPFIDNLNFLPSIVENSLHSTIFQQFETTSSLLLQFFLKEKNCLSHLRSIRNYFLFGASFWGELFASRLFTLSPWTNVQLQKFLEDTLKITLYYNRDPNSHLLKLCLSSENLNSSKNVEDLQLNYNVDFALNLLFLPEIKKKYNMVFLFILQAKRVETELKLCYVTDRKRYRHKGNDISIHSIRFKFQCFLNMFKQYLALQHESLWNEFIQTFEKIKSFDELQVNHTNFLNKVIESCFLNNSSSEILKSIRDFWKLFFLFSTQVKNYYKEKKPEPQEIILKSIFSIDSTFDKIFSRFVENLQKLYVKDFSPFINILLEYLHIFEFTTQNEEV